MLDMSENDKHLTIKLAEKVLKWHSDDHIIWYTEKGKYGVFNPLKDMNDVMILLEKVCPNDDFFELRNNSFKLNGHHPKISIYADSPKWAEYDFIERHCRMICEAISIAYGITSK